MKATLEIGFAIFVGAVCAVLFGVGVGVGFSLGARLMIW